MHMKKNYETPLCEVETIRFGGALLAGSTTPTPPIDPAPRRGDYIYG